jgi:hypothetical protein
MKIILQYFSYTWLNESDRFFFDSNFKVGKNGINTALIEQWEKAVDAFIEDLTNQG